MGEYVQIGGLRTWYEQEGSGEPLVLLHGGMATNESWASQMPEFAARFRVIAPERRAHGHTPDLPGPLSYDVMAADTIGFLETVVGGSAHLDDRFQGVSGRRPTVIV
jgi:pimeloyl-ACP methyl ester carboxylesterase